MSKSFNSHFNIKPQKIGKYFYFLAAAVVLICLFFATKFLYDNFYLSITQSREVVVLKEKVAPETIDLNIFENILENIKEKTKSKTTKISSNPFE